jgi:hypothetical protein
MKISFKALLLGAAVLSPAAASADVTLTPQEMIQVGCTQNPDGTLHCTHATRPAQINMLQKKMDAMKRANVALPPSQKPAINPNTGKAP